MTTATEPAVERIATLGGVPEGRPAAVDANSRLPDFREGQIRVEETVERMRDIVDTISQRMRGRMLCVGEVHPVSQDALIQAADELEKQAWMLRAQPVG